MVKPKSVKGILSNVIRAEETARMAAGRRATKHATVRAMRAERPGSEEPTLAQEIKAEDRAERSSRPTKAQMAQRIEMLTEQRNTLEGMLGDAEARAKVAEIVARRESTERRKLTEDVSAVASSLARCGDGEAVISRMLFGALRFHGTSSPMVRDEVERD